MPKIVQAHLDRQAITAVTEQGAAAHICRVRSVAEMYVWPEQDAKARLGAVQQ